MYFYLENSMFPLTADKGTMHRLDAVSTRRRLDSTPTRLDAAGGQTQHHSFNGAFPQDYPLGSPPGDPAQKAVIFCAFDFEIVFFPTGTDDQGRFPPGGASSLPRRAVNLATSKSPKSTRSTGSPVNLARRIARSDQIICRAAEAAVGVLDNRRNHFVVPHCHACMTMLV